MSTLTTIGHSFEFDPNRRDDYEFSDPTKITLGGATGGFPVLKKDATTGLYPTADDIYIRTRLLAPNAVRQWVGVWARVVNAKDGTGAVVTSVQYRLNDGTNDYYWSGAAWVVAGAGNWNTLDDVATNLSTFPVTAHQIRLVFNLKTTDGNYTPTVVESLIAFDAAIPSFAEETIYRTIVRLLRDNVRTTLDSAVRWNGGTSYLIDIESFDDALYFDQEPMIVGVDCAFDLTSDPDQYNNILSGYNSTTKVITLTTPVSPGSVVLFRLIVVPLVALSTHEDYDQQSGVPAVVLRSYQELFSNQIPGVNHALTGGADAITFRGPRQVRIEIPLDIFASRGLEVARTCESVQRFIKTNPVVRSPGLDSMLRLDIDDEMGHYPRPDEDNVQRGTLTLMVGGAEKWLYGTGSGSIVTQVNTTITTEDGDI